MKTFSFRDRDQFLKQMQKETFDLLVIGGGITGAGIARDAALRGMKVALIEARDFASGTSSRSSKLVHGGIRYLENYEFKLVFEALSERQKLFEIAPHLVHPLRFMIPLYKGGRVGMGLMGAGMWLYDALSLFRAPEMHEHLSAQESLLRMPTLQGKDLLGSYIYSDAYMDDDRLVHETLRSAVAHGALAVNYVNATGVVKDSKGKVKAVICRDTHGQKEFQIRATRIVSSVGPWTDELASQFFGDWRKILRPTKGVHLTFEKKRLPLSSAVVMAAEKRIVFGIPRHEMVIVGTTDTDFSDSPGSVVTKKEDVQYLLGVIDQYFPGAKIHQKDIVASYAGVRPLVNDNAQSEGKTSREHVIFTDQHDITYVAGGKYTTYRLMAQQVVEKVLQTYPIEKRVQWNRCLTNSPLNPLITQESRQEDFSIVDRVLASKRWRPEEARLFVDRHGAEAIKIIEKFKNVNRLWQVEAAHAIESTMCLNIVDFYTRRVPLFLAEKDHGLSLYEDILKVFADHYAWDPSEKKNQRELLDHHLKFELGWQN